MALAEAMDTDRSWLATRQQRNVISASLPGTAFGWYDICRDGPVAAIIGGLIFIKSSSPLLAKAGDIDADPWSATATALVVLAVGMIIASIGGQRRNLFGEDRGHQFCRSGQKNALPPKGWCISSRVPVRVRRDFSGLSFPAAGSGYCKKDGGQSDVEEEEGHERQNLDQ